MSVTISVFLETYLSQRQASGSYRLSLRRTVRKASDAGIVKVSDLQPAQVNKMLANLSSVVSPVTCSNVRRELLTLWQAAFDQELTEIPPLRIAKIKVPRKPPRAWSLADLKRMLDDATKDQTACGGLANPRICDWVPAWILIGYETAMRFTDVYTLSADDLYNHCVCVYANKTGKPLTRRLSDRAWCLAQRLVESSQDGFLFKWMLTRRRTFLSWRSFLDRHGFKGSSRWLRRSAATYLELEKAGSAAEFLQHSTPTLVAKHYIDQTLGSAPSPPPMIS